MDQASVASRLADLHLPATRYFGSLDSTNDEAWRWVDRGASHGALVIADEQTAGRGRLQRHWVTVPNSALAFSLVLLAPPLKAKLLTRLTGLGALAACQALSRLYSLPAQIKWPNDILLDRRKTGGVLVETRWNGARLSAAVIGIGINIAPESIDPQHLPAEGWRMPVTCVENILGQAVDRLELLHGILEELFGWLPRLASADFIHASETRLAYRHQWVELTLGADVPTGSLDADRLLVAGTLIGLSPDGSLKLLTASGELITVQAGEIHLRPASSLPG